MQEASRSAARSRPNGCKMDRPRACPQGHEVQSDAARFCPECGQALVATGPASAPTPTRPRPDTQKTLTPVAAPAAPSPAPLACKCGQILVQDAIFCHRCGQRQTSEPQFALHQIQPVSGQPRLLSEDITLIGKSQDCGLCISDDEYVSRQHARIVRSQGAMLLEDAGSSNGTFLKIRKPIAVDAGDEILIGSTVLRLEQI